MLYEAKGGSGDIPRCFRGHCYDGAEQGSQIHGI